MPRDVLAAIAAVVHAEAIRRFGVTGGVSTPPPHRADRPAVPDAPPPAIDPRPAPDGRAAARGRWLTAALRVVRRRG
jgi:hypothetical protein